MASADFSLALTGELSPGKVLILSLRAVRLYLVRLGMDFGLRGGQHAYRPYAASLPICVPTVEGLFPAAFSFPSRLPVRLHLAVPYGYLHRSRQDRFILLESAHAGHTGAGLLAGSVDLQVDVSAHAAPLPRAREKTGADAGPARQRRAPHPDLALLISTRSSASDYQRPVGKCTMPPFGAGHAALPGLDVLQAPHERPI